MKFTPKEIKTIENLIFDFVKNNSKRKIYKFRDYILPFPFITNITSYPGAYVKNPLNIKSNVIGNESVEDSVELEVSTKGYIEKSVIDLDAASLYPSIIYSLNCSHETLLYIIPEQIAAAYIITKKALFEHYGLNPETEISFEDIKNVLSKEKYFLFFKENDSGKEFYEFLKRYLEKYQKIKIYDFSKQKYMEFLTAAEFIKFLYTEVEIKFRPISITGGIFANVKEREGVVRKLIKIPIIKRNEIKELMKKVPNPIVYEDKNKLFKLKANSIYGYTGYKKSRLFNVFIASTITLQGRVFIKFVSGEFNNLVQKLKKSKLAKKN